MTTKHTPGRWFADAKGNIWRRPPSDLYQNGGSVAGDKPLAFAFVGWHGENDTGYPVEANARLIAAAPELLEALQELCEIVEDAIEQKSAKDLDSFTLQLARAAIAKATGAQPAQRMNMQTADQVTQAFKAELQALLDKYGAELSARDTWEGYPECGEDVRMQVNVPAIYDADHNCLREYTEIDLGSWVLSTQAMPKEAKP